MNAARRMLKLSAALAHTLGLVLETPDDRRRAAFALSLAVDLLRDPRLGLSDEARTLAVEGMAAQDDLYAECEDLIVGDYLEGDAPRAAAAAPPGPEEMADHPAAAPVADGIGDSEAIRIVEAARQANGATAAATNPFPSTANPGQA